MERFGKGRGLKKGLRVDVAVSRFAKSYQGIVDFGFLKLFGSVRVSFGVDSE